MLSVVAASRKYRSWFNVTSGRRATARARAVTAAVHAVAPRLLGPA